MCVTSIHDYNIEVCSYNILVFRKVAQIERPTQRLQRAILWAVPGLCQLFSNVESLTKTVE